MSKANPPTSNNLEDWIRGIFEKHSEDKSPDLELFDTTAIIEELALEITNKEREARIDELVRLFWAAGILDTSKAKYVKDRLAELKGASDE